MQPDDPTHTPDTLERRSTDLTSPEMAHAAMELGPYRLVQPIGVGGMGEVWLAEQQHPVRRQVAIKLIKLGMASRPVIARFEAERQALALMDHPAVARVFEAGTAPGGAPYFVMEYVRGLPITAYCDRHRLPMRARLELFQRVCEGVQHAHHKAILHRDLKPSNILVSEHDGRPAPKIIDFGLAKAMAQKLTDTTLHTEVGAFLGTPEYMSPEQAELTHEDVDTRTDVYSLGVLLYELLVGALPFDSQTLRSAGFDGARRIIREQDPLRPSLRLSQMGERATESARDRGEDPQTLRRQLAGDLDWIVLKAIEKDRARRYDSPNELARDISRYLADEPVVARPPSAAYRARKFVRRHRGVVAAASLLALTLIAGVIGTTVGLMRAREAEGRARAQAERSERVSRFLAQILHGIDPQRLGRDLEADLERRVAASGSLDAVNFVDVSAGLIDRQIFSPARAMIDTSLADEPELAARLEYTLGTSYHRGLQLFEPAVAALRRSMALGESVRGPGTEPDWELAMELGMALVRRGGSASFAEAESLLRSVVTARRARGGPDDVLALTAGTQIGGVLRMQGRGAESESTLREVIAGMQRVRGVPPLDQAFAANNLALVLRDDPATHAESDSLFRAAISRCERELGPDHYETLSARLNRVRLLLTMQRDADAEAELRRLLDDGRASIGLESDLALQARVALADAVKNQGRNEEAVALYRDAERDMRRPGNSSRSLGASILNRSGALHALGRTREAIRELTAFAEEQQRAGTELGMRRVGLALERLARLHTALGAREAALACLRRLAETGQGDADAVAADPDLRALHGAAFDAVVARMRAVAAGGS